MGTIKPILQKSIKSNQLIKVDDMEPNAVDGFNHFRDSAVEAELLALGAIKPVMMPWGNVEMEYTEKALKLVRENGIVTEKQDGTTEISLPTSRLLYLLKFFPAED